MPRLREIEERDLDVINRWRNDPELIAQLGAPFRYIGPSVDERWFEAYVENRSRQVRCAIVDGEDAIVGLVSLVDIDHLNGCAELHIMIGEKDSRGKGVGTYAVREMLHHAFLNLNLNRVELSVIEYNVRACRLYEKCGFVHEGTRRKARYKNGKYYDMETYSVLREEYVEKRVGGGTLNRRAPSRLPLKHCCRTTPVAGLSRKKPRAFPQG